MGVAEYDTDLRWGCALLREFAYLIHNLLWCRFEPGGRGAGVWDSTGRYAFAVAVESTHCCVFDRIVDGLPKAVVRVFERPLWVM